MKSINKITALNIGSTVLLQGIAFFTTPIFTRVLGSEQFGIYAVFHSWVSILTCVMGGGVSNTLGTGRYQFKESYYEFRSSILLFGTVISLGLISIILLLIVPVSRILNYNILMILLVVLSALGQYVVNFVQNAYIYEKKAELNFILSVTLSITTVVLSLILIPLFTSENKYKGRILGTCIPYIIIAIILWCTTFKKKATGLHRKYCRYGLSVGVPVVFHTLAHNVLTQSDRVMMRHMNVTNSEIGIYSLYYNFIAVMSTILNALNTSWCPFYYDDVDSKNWNALETKCRNYIEIFTVLTVGFLLLSREVSYVLANSEFWDGISIIPVLVLAVYFTFMYQFPVNFEFFYRKTKTIALGTFGAAILNIILNMIMIPIWGMYGAAAATTLSYGALFVLHFFIVTNMKETKYHLKLKVFIPGLIMTCCGILLFYILKRQWYVRWGVGAVIGIYELQKIINRKSIF